MANGMTGLYIRTVVLLEETLEGLRKKAEELQQDNWMFQDAQF